MDGQKQDRLVGFTSHHNVWEEILAVGVGLSCTSYCKCEGNDVCQNPHTKSASQLDSCSDLDESDDEMEMYSTILLSFLFSFSYYWESDETICL